MNAALGATARESSPAEWGQVTLEEISAFITKGTTPTTFGFSWADNGVRFLRSECVSENGLDLDQSMFISEEAHEALIRGEVVTGDILITITGYVGRVVFLDAPGFRANINQHVARIRVVDDRAVGRYVYHVLSSRPKRRFYESIVTGQAYPQISLAQVRETEIQLPPLREQKAIAEALGDVDELIGGLEKLIAKKRDIKQAAMQQLLTGKTRLPGFTDPWATQCLGELGRFDKGKGIRKNELALFGHPCLLYGEIYTTHNYIVREFASFIPAHVAATSRSLRKGDIVFAATGEKVEDIGKCAAFVGDFEAYVGSDTVVWSPDDGDSRFFAFLLNQPWISAQKSRLAQGNVVVHIAARALASVRVTVPDRREQSAIAEVLSDMDAEIEALEARLEKTRDLKQGMMQELLTGRTRLV